MSFYQYCRLRLVQCIDRGEIYNLPRVSKTGKSSLHPSNAVYWRTAFDWIDSFGVIDSAAFLLTSAYLLWFQISTSGVALISLMGHIARMKEDQKKADGLMVMSSHSHEGCKAFQWIDTEPEDHNAVIKELEEWVTEVAKKAIVKFDCRIMFLLQVISKSSTFFRKKDIKFTQAGLSIMLES